MGEMAILLPLLILSGTSWAEEKQEEETLPAGPSIYREEIENILDFGLSTEELLASLLPDYLYPDLLEFTAAYLEEERLGEMLTELGASAPEELKKVYRQEGYPGVAEELQRQGILKEEILRILPQYLADFTAKEILTDLWRNGTSDYEIWCALKGQPTARRRWRRYLVMAEHGASAAQLLQVACRGTTLSDLTAFALSLVQEPTEVTLLLRALGTTLPPAAETWMFLGDPLWTSHYLAEAGVTEEKLQEVLLRFAARLKVEEMLELLSIRERAWAYWLRTLGGDVAGIYEGQAEPMASVLKVPELGETLAQITPEDFQLTPDLARWFAQLPTHFVILYRDRTVRAMVTRSDPSGSEHQVYGYEGTYVAERKEIRLLWRPVEGWPEAERKQLVWTEVTWPLEGAFLQAQVEPQRWMLLRRTAYLSLAHGWTNSSGPSLTPAEKQEQSQ